MESTATKRRRVGGAWNWRCAYCGSAVEFGLWDHQRYRHKGSPEERATIDHVIPLSRGGTETPENEVLACFGCNSSKGRLTLEEWLESPNCRIPRWRCFAFLLGPVDVAA